MSWIYPASSLQVFPLSQNFMYLHFSRTVYHKNQVSFREKKMVFITRYMLFPGMKQFQGWKGLEWSFNQDILLQADLHVGNQFYLWRCIEWTLILAQHTKGTSHPSAVLRKELPNFHLLLDSKAKLLMLWCLSLVPKSPKRGLILWTRPMVRTNKLNLLGWVPGVVLNRNPDFGPNV